MLTDLLRKNDVKSKNLVQNGLCFVPTQYFLFQCEIYDDPLLLGSHVIVGPVLCILPLIQNKLFFDVTRFNVILAAFDEIEKKSMGV